MLLGKAFLPVPRSEVCAFAPLSGAKAGFVWGGDGEVRMVKSGGAWMVLFSKV